MREPSSSGDDDGQNIESVFLRLGRMVNGDSRGPGVDLLTIISLSISQNKSAPISNNQNQSESISSILLLLGKVAKKKKPEKMWAFAKLPSDPPPVWHFFTKKIYPHFFC